MLTQGKKSEGTQVKGSSTHTYNGGFDQSHKELTAQEYDLAQA